MAGKTIPLEDFMPIDASSAGSHAMTDAALAAKTAHVMAKFPAELASPIIREAQPEDDEYRQRMRALIEAEVS